MGATWQAVIFGFAGLQENEDGETETKPVLSPKLPKDWKKLSFHFYKNGKRYAAVIEGDKWKIMENNKTESAKR